MFTNRLKTRLTFFFFQNGFKNKENSQPFEEISLEEFNKCLQQLYLSVRKRDGRRFGHYAPKLLSLTTVNELKIIIFVFNYLTVLVYTKTDEGPTTGHLHFSE